MGAKGEEDKGIIEFMVYKNDGQMDSMRALIDLKNIVAKQLPKMPKEYITRLIMDRNHESMILQKKFPNTATPKKIIGGIVYRPFEKNKFVEIAFLAITSLEQVKGYGTRLMNKLKAHLQAKQFQYMLTYADNNAIGYFKKQGFSTIPRIPKHLWYGYIKDYDGGTLMDCCLNPDIDYNDIYSDLKRQKEAVIDAIKGCYFLKRFKGLEWNKSQGIDSVGEKSGKKKKLESEYTTIIEDKKGEERPKVYLNYLKSFHEIPGLKESGWDIDSFKESLLAYDTTSFFKQCQNILKLLNNHTSSWPFKKPVNLDEVPDYKQYIAEPMDLETIEKKLESRINYLNKESFKKDIALIFSNAKQYNKPTTIYYRYAVELEEFIKPHLETMKDPTETELQEYQKLTKAKIDQSENEESSKK